MPPLHQHPRFKLLRQLGTGGSAVVWQGENMLDGTAVAIKVFPNSDEARWHCREEYQKTNQHQHPNILHILEQGEWRGESYLVMPFYAKGSAQDRIGGYSEAECWRICLDIALALQYLHERKPVVLHNDLKPDNFLCTDRGRYILADLGISLELKKEYLQSLSGQSIEKSAAGSSPEAYRAPERFAYRNQEKSIPTIKSEIWSFGACLFQIATGQTPYGERGGFFQMMTREQGTRLRDLRRDFPAHFSDDFKNLVLDCLQYDLMERPGINEIINNAQNALAKWSSDSDVVDTLAQHNPELVSPAPHKSLFSMSMLIMIAFLFLMIAMGYMIFSDGWFGMKENIKVESNSGKPIVTPPKQSAVTATDPDPVPGTIPRDDQSGSLKSGNNPASQNKDEGPGFPLAEFLRDIDEVIKKYPKGSPCETSLSVLKAQIKKCKGYSNTKCAQILLCQADPFCGNIVLLQKKYGCNIAIQGEVDLQNYTDLKTKASTDVKIASLDQKINNHNAESGQQFRGIQISAASTSREANRLAIKERNNISNWGKKPEEKVIDIVIIDKSHFLIVHRAINLEHLDHLKKKYGNKDFREIKYRQKGKYPNHWFVPININ